MNQNRWHFAFVFNGEGRLAVDKAFFFSNPYLRLEAFNLHPAPRHYRRGERDIILLGNPIYDGKRDDLAVLAALDRPDPERVRFSSLDGSFLVLIFDGVTHTLTIANDRFASLALYISGNQKIWYGASSLKWLWDCGCAGERVDEIAAAEFLFLRRLLAEKTLASEARYLESASILRLTPNQNEISARYWSPDYSLAPPDPRTLPGEIADTLVACMRAHQSDNRQMALLLSGGLDSRALLAAAHQPLTCVTTCLRENNESDVAREVAQQAGAPFQFVPRPIDLYDRVFEDAVFLTGGQQVYSEAQFLGYSDRWPHKCETFLIGLGLDIFFGGLYLPKISARMFGHPALHYKLMPLEADIAVMYLDRVSYRMKQSDPNLVVKKSARGRIRSDLLDSVNQIMERGCTLGAKGYTLWEHMHLHNLSRHYSFPMMMSVRTYADCRAPALANGVFELALRMSGQQKVNGSHYQDAITKLAPKLMAVRNANTNMAAHMSLRRQTATKAAWYAANKAFGVPYPAAPGSAERSWPTAKQSLAASPTILRRVRELSRSQRLAALSFIDMDGLRMVVDDHLEGRADHAIMLNVLLTLDCALDRGTAAGS